MWCVWATPVAGSCAESPLTYDEGMVEKAPAIRFGLYDLLEARPGIGLDRLYRERFELIAAAYVACVSLGIPLYMVRNRHHEVCTGACTSFHKPRLW